MFISQEVINKVLEQLVGNVEWVYHSSDIRGKTIIFRVDGELKGFNVCSETFGREGCFSSTYEEMVFSEVHDERLLQVASWLSLTLKKDLLTQEEQKEWESICKRKEQGRKEIDRKLEREKEAREKAQYLELKKKYEK